MASNKLIKIQRTNDKFQHLIGQKFNERYEIQTFLGDGAFGKVFKVKDYVPMKAMKIINGELQNDALTEIEILQKVKSQYLVKYFANFSSLVNFFMVFEYCSNGDLGEQIQNHIKNHQQIDDEKIKNWTIDILDGLNFLHTNLRVVHFDLKPPNIFMSELDRCKIGDLGLARSYESLSKLSDIRGTLCYMSPELIAINGESTIDFKTDIWSFGCIVYEMVTLKKAFYDPDISKLRRKIVEVNVKIPENINDVIKRIIELCLVKKKYRNISCKDLWNKIRKHTSDIEKSLRSNLKYLKKNKGVTKKNADLKFIIGNDYFALGEFNNALKYHKESLTMYRKLFDEDHPDIATSLNRVGIVYEELGDYDNALKYHNQSLKMRRNVFQGDHDDIATSINSIGDVYDSLGDFKNALIFYVESLQMYKKIFQGDNFNIATALNSVGVAYDGLGDYKSALKYYRESLKMYKKLFQGDHPDIATSLNNIGFIYNNMGDFNNALKYYNDSLRMERKLFTGDNPDVAISLNNVGAAYEGMGDFSNALKYYNESLNMKRNIFEGDHTDIATSLNNLGAAYRRLGDYKNAFKFYSQSLQMNKNLYDKNHPNIASSLSNIGLVYNELGYYKNALKFHNQSLLIKRKFFEQDHPDIAISLNYVGAAYEGLGDYNNALTFYDKSLQMNIKLLPENHPDILNTTKNISIVKKKCFDCKV